MGIEGGYNHPYYTVGFSTGIYYRKARLESSFSFMDSTQKFSEVTERIDISWLEFPIWIRFRAGQNKRTREITYGGPYLELGVTILYRLSSNYKITGAYSLTENLTTIKPIHIAGSIGFGFHQIGTESISITHGLRITVSISDIASVQKPTAIYRAPELLNTQSSIWQRYAWTRFLNVQYVFSFWLKFLHKAYR